MSRLDFGYLIIGAIFATDLITRIAYPDVITPEYLETWNEVVPLIEILFISICLMQTVPKLFRKVKSKTVYDIIVYSCFFIGCGIVIFILPDFIPADATKEDADYMIKIVVYLMLGAFLTVYFLWETHKQKVAKRKNEQSKAESDAIHEKAMMDATTEGNEQ